MNYIINIFALKIPKNPPKTLNYPQKGISMAYVSKSCDFWKVKMGRWADYVIK
jgi:hypothetical protein